MESVLVGDELAKKIRDAFDAYIFLSYRKKDRKHAQQIMHLIHENEFCRDIAIWYDEFLVPGEGGDHAIEQAMNKSSLFVMVVTPNLLERPNYVRTVEYENAKNSTKPILPIEAVATDLDAIRDYYDDIPEIVSCNRERILSERLLKCIVLGCIL